MSLQDTTWAESRNLWLPSRPRAAERGDALQAQLLYCSILVPHPPYRSNETYMTQIMELDIKPPQWVPKPQVHPFDLYSSKAKGLWNIDDVQGAVVTHFRRVYFSMCVEADALLGRSLRGHRHPTALRTYYSALARRQAPRCTGRLAWGARPHEHRDDL